MAAFDDIQKALREEDFNRANKLLENASQEELEEIRRLAPMAAASAGDQAELYAEQEDTLKRIVEIMCDRDAETVSELVSMDLSPTERAAVARWV